MKYDPNDPEIMLFVIPVDRDPDQAVKEMIAQNISTAFATTRPFMLVPLSDREFYDGALKNTISKYTSQGDIVEYNDKTYTINVLKRGMVPQRKQFNIRGVYLGE